MPSLFEGLPISGVEAQSAGLPCVMSNTITKELVYTDLVKFISLQDSKNNWVRALEAQIKRKPDRYSYKEELRKSPFSSERAGERLEKMYMSFLVRNMKENG